MQLCKAGEKRGLGAERREHTRAVFSSEKKYGAEKKFPATSNLRYMHGVLNVDEIKN
jgi:hypothetical protein